ncbi:MAG: biopolymer transporter ExbD [Treponema sp.]|jgi:biopolymer transport protein ExbD|nr:biopolymer transporter ExbD [Treponema sp.]
MKINRRKKPGFIDTCVSNDCAFLLIIYFLVIAGFNINKGFIMNLPAKDSTRMILREELLRFDMSSSGDITFAEEIITIPRAKSLIQSAQHANPDIAVLITIDSQTRWQNVVSFVELAQDLQINAFSFSMNKDNHEN